MTLVLRRLSHQLKKMQHQSREDVTNQRLLTLLSIIKSPYVINKMKMPLTPVAPISQCGTERKQSVRTCHRNGQDYQTFRALNDTGGRKSWDSDIQRLRSVLPSISSVNFEAASSPPGALLEIGFGCRID